jgi:hypothetical protein
MALVLVSCASTSTGIAPSVPSGAGATFLTDALGARPDASVFVRPAALTADPYWGPVVARVVEGHDTWHRLASATQIDVHFSVRDPLFFMKRKASDPAALGWIAIVHGASEKPDADSISGTTFVAGDGTFVVTDSVSASRVSALLAREAPPTLEASPDALAGATFSVTSLRFFKSGNGDGLVHGMTAVGYGLRGGSNGALEGYADYASSDDAEHAYAAFEQTCVARTDGCIVPPMWFRDARAVKHDRRITVTLTFSEALLRSLSTIGR